MVSDGVQNFTLATTKCAPFLHLQSQKESAAIGSIKCKRALVHQTFDSSGIAGSGPLFRKFIDVKTVLTLQVNLII